MDESSAPFIIDSHAHIFPDPLGKVAPKLAHGTVGNRLADLRRFSRAWFRPFAKSLHRTQTFLRLLPDGARRKADEINILAPLPSLLIESTPADLAETMDVNGVAYTIVIAHPPVISNEFILEACAENPRLIPAVNIPRAETRPGPYFKKLLNEGARILKIHPAADGDGPDCERYKALLTLAADRGIPVIIHTGCIHSSVMYRAPEMGHVERFRDWLDTYNDVRFVLAHMNYHEPEKAFDLAEDRANVFVDTSWQPTEIIAEAVRRLGAEKVMFGTDWPFAGANFEVGLGRIDDAWRSGFISSEQRARILGLNAAELFGIDALSVEADPLEEYEEGDLESGVTDGA